MRVRRTALLVAIGLAAGGARAAAQETPASRETEARFSDRIMAVIGGNLLLESEWQEQVLLLSEQLGIRPGSPEFARVAGEAFEQMVDDLVIVAAAERDTTIQIDSERAAEAADQELAAIRARFPTEEEFQSQLRQSQWGSLAAYRADLMERKRRELLGQAFLESHAGSIRAQPVNDADVRAFWKQNQASLGPRPETFRFEEIPVLVKPSAAGRDSALAEANAVLAELRAGGDFAALARQHSDDPGSREEGGDLGWFGHGRMVAPFEKAAFAAAPGELIGPVETAFGVHVLQVIDVRQDEVQARHILFAFERSAEDRARAREDAEALAEAIAAGADVDSLQALYMPGDSAAAGLIELATEQLPPEYASALEGLEPGRTAVIETTTGFSVVVARGTGGGTVATFEEVAPAIRRQLAQERAEKAFVERLREQVYVDIRITPQSVLSAG
ncbi:peptidylprolyl isomerase [soil metagenome]